MPQVASDAPMPAPKPILPPSTRPAPSSGPGMIFDSLLDDSSRAADPPPAQTSQTGGPQPQTQQTTKPDDPVETPQASQGSQTPRAPKKQPGSQGPKVAANQKGSPTANTSPVAKQGPTEPTADTGPAEAVETKGAPPLDSVTQPDVKPQLDTVVHQDTPAQTEVPPSPVQTIDTVQTAIGVSKSAKAATDGAEGLGTPSKTANASKSANDTNPVADNTPAVDAKPAIAQIQLPAAAAIAPPVAPMQPAAAGPAPVMHAAAAVVQAAVAIKIPQAATQTEPGTPSAPVPNDVAKGADNTPTPNSLDFSALQDAAKPITPHTHDETQGATPHGSADKPVTSTTNSQAAMPKGASDLVQQTTLPPPNMTSAAGNPTTPTSPTAPSTPVSAQVVAMPISGIAIQIATMAQAGKNRFEIRLDPPELGRIEVRLDVDRDGHVTSRLIADRSDTLNLLRNDATGLERALQDAGLKTAGNGLQFSLRDQTMNGGQQNAAANASNTTQIVVQDSTVPAGDLPQSIYSRLAGLRGGVDIRV